MINDETVGIEIQRAMNKHKFRSVVYLAVALSNAVISIPLCIRWQGFGAAIGTTLATFVGNVLLMNWYYHHRIGLNIPAFWRHIFHLFPATVLPAAVSVALAVFVHPQTYFDMILPAAAVVAVYGGSMWLFGMNRYERELIASPVRRILKRLHR